MDNTRTKVWYPFIPVKGASVPACIYDAFFTVTSANITAAATGSVYSITLNKEGSSSSLLLFDIKTPDGNGQIAFPLEASTDVQRLVTGRSAVTVNLSQWSDDILGDAATYQIEPCRIRWRVGGWSQLTFTGLTVGGATTARSFYKGNTIHLNSGKNVSISFDGSNIIITGAPNSGEGVVSSTEGGLIQTINGVKPRNGNIDISVSNSLYTYSTGSGVLIFANNPETTSATGSTPGGGAGGGGTVGGVTSVNGQTGVVELTSSDVGADSAGTASGLMSYHEDDTQAHADLFAAKVDKIAGKGLSTNDFTDVLETKLNALPPITGVDGTTIIMNESGVLVVPGGGGGSQSISWEAKAASFVAVTGKGYFTDAAAGDVTATLPDTPLTGDTIWFYVVSSSNSVYLEGNGNKVEGSLSTYNLTTSGFKGPLIYSGASYGWVKAVSSLEDSRYVLRSEMEFKTF